MRLNKWFLAALVGLSSACSAKVPEVPLNVVKADSWRVGEVVFRYVRFDTESSYPCLRLETIEPIDEKLVDRRDICGFEPEEGEAISFFDDVSYVGFDNMRREKSGFAYEVNFMRRVGLQEYRVECQVGISDGQLGETRCESPRRIEG